MVFERTRGQYLDKAKHLNSSAEEINFIANILKTDV